MAQASSMENEDFQYRHGTVSPSLRRREVLALIASAAVAPLLPGRARAQTQQAHAVVREPAPRPLRAPSDGTFDILHGVRVDDPFRPLEDPTRPDVAAWIEAEDQAARAALESNPVHADVSAFLRRTQAFPRASEHRKLGDRVLARVHDGQREQSWLELRETSDGRGRPLIDPNSMATGGAVTLIAYFADRQSQRIAYLTTENGGDAQTLRVRDVRSNSDLADRIEGCRFSSVVWLADGSGFYYCRPPRDGESAHPDLTSHQLYLHVLGTPPASDRLLWRVPSGANVTMALRATPSQLIVNARNGSDERMGVWIGPLGDPQQLRNIVPAGRSSFTLVTTLGPALYAITDLDAPRGRLVRVLAGDPRPEAWLTIVPEGDGVIDAATTVGNRLVVRHFRNLGHYLTIHDLDGRKLADVSLGERLRINIERGERTQTSMRLDVDDYRRPFRQVRLSVPSGRAEVLPAPAPPHTLDDVEIRETTARSRDGTSVPVTLIHQPGLALDGTNRTLLYGYGSYGISQHPAWSGLIAAWVRLGGVFAVATIRGGSEFGRDWHENGRRHLKLNAVADFIAAAEHLVETRITRPALLGTHGASSGGRLVLGAMVARPDLFGAVAAGVPLVDMLRFPLHTVGGSWRQEYGDPEDPEDFRALLALSPLHNVRAGVAYPPVLILTAENDERVVPAHAHKMAATLKRQAPDTEVLLRTRRGAGHSLGNALSKGIAYHADIVTFLASRLGGPLRSLPKV